MKAGGGRTDGRVPDKFLHLIKVSRYDYKVGLLNSANSHEIGLLLPVLALNLELPELVEFSPPSHRPPLVLPALPPRAGRSLSLQRSRLQKPGRRRRRCV